MAGRSETVILLVRHGESTDNVDRRLGSLAPGAPLTDRGRAQASALGVRLAARNVAAVYASPLVRARETGEILAASLGCDLATRDELREIGLGQTEGSTAESDIARIGAQYLRWLSGHLTEGLDGDEPGGAVVARMSASLAAFAGAHPGATVVAVSHGGAIGLAVSMLADNVTDDYAMTHPLANCGIAEIVRADGRWTLRSWSGDPDRAPHPGDLIDLVGRADAEQVRSHQASAAVGTAVDLGGVPCVHFGISQGWGTHASFTERSDLPADEIVDAVCKWLEARSPGSWQVTVRPEQVESVGARGLRVLRELAVLITDSCPAYTPPDGITLGPARTAAEFLSVFGTDLAPVLIGEFGQPGQEFLVLRDVDQILACARLSAAGGCACLSGVIVRPDRRGEGLGTVMSAEATARAVHHTGLVWLHCEAELIGFYERLGYRPVTRHVHLGPASG
jgi:broad specificity phosphatase PhoE/GNAT superfamily N-acetyltransferase